MRNLGPYCYVFCVLGSCWPVAYKPGRRNAELIVAFALPPLPPLVDHTYQGYIWFCVECLPADKPWDVVSAPRRSSGVTPRACVRVHARVLVPPNLYMHTYIFFLQVPVGPLLTNLAEMRHHWEQTLRAQHEQRQQEARVLDVP